MVRRGALGFEGAECAPHRRRVVDVVVVVVMVVAGGGTFGRRAGRRALRRADAGVVLQDEAQLQRGAGLFQKKPQLVGSIHFWTTLKLWTPLAHLQMA